jgi:hypothetical protein
MVPFAKTVCGPEISVACAYVFVNVMLYLYFRSIMLTSVYYI